MELASKFRGAYDRFLGAQMVSEPFIQRCHMILCFYGLRFLLGTKVLEALKVDACWSVSLDWVIFCGARFSVMNGHFEAAIVLVKAGTWGSSRQASSRNLLKNGLHSFWTHPISSTTQMKHPVLLICMLSSAVLSLFRILSDDPGPCVSHATCRCSLGPSQNGLRFGHRHASTFGSCRSLVRSETNRNRERSNQSRLGPGG